MRMEGLGNKAIMSRNLRRLMAERRISAKELSKRLDFPYTTLLSWLKGDNYPRLDKIEAMAEFFGVLKSDLIEEQAPEEIKGPAMYDGLSENQKRLMQFVQGVPESKADMILRVIQSIVESD